MKTCYDQGYDIGVVIATTPLPIVLAAIIL